jgi:hypothetical protein
MKRPMPGVLKIFMVLCAGLGALTGLACLAFLAAATMGGGPYMVQGAVVSRDEFMAFAVPTLLGQAALCAFAVAAAWGLYRRRYWARPLLFGMTLAAFAFSLMAGAVVGMPWERLALTTVTGTLAALFLWWTLYRRDEVADWFEALKAAQSESQ